MAKWLGIFALAAAASCGRTATHETPVKLTAAIEQGRSVLRIFQQGGAGSGAALVLDRDDTVAAESQTVELATVGQTAGAVVVIDTYASRPGPMSMCQAGEEKFLRVIRLGEAPAETMRVKLASCRNDIEPEAPGYVFDKGAATLEVRWLSGPDGKKSARYRIESDGTVAAL